MPINAHQWAKSAFLLLSVLATGLGAAGQAPQSGAASAVLPQRNLIVELRQSEQAEAQDQGAGISVRSGVRLGGAAGVTLQAHSQRSDSGLTQQVRVLNGAQASMRFGQALALQGWQVAWTPQGVQALPGTQWVEAVSGFVVRPSWRGAEQPVQLELSADTGSLPVDSAPSATHPVHVLSTVQMPLGQWVEVARSGDTGRTRERGVLSTRDAQSQQRVVIELRVTVPE